MIQDDIRSRVTAEIVKALENGVVPWRKPWTAAQNTGFPVNVISKRHYSGVNPLLLHLSALDKGFQSQWWGTYNQWRAVGGQVKRRPADVPAGGWGTRIIFFKPIVRVEKDANGDEKERTFPLLREFTVFNADQVEGVPQFQVQAATEQHEPDFGPAETVITATKADIRHVAGDKAAYHRREDYITLPLKGQFDGGLSAYYDTAFHELGHWSEVRLDWKGSYALGELRAEMAAAFISAEIGIPSSDGLRPNHAAYLAHWIGAMKEDHRVIFRIASAASAAADYILSFSREEKTSEDEAA